jgi:hypothetical protein
MAWNATWMDTTPHLGQAGRLDESQALSSRPGLSFLDTSAGRVRVRRSEATGGPPVLFGADGPNVIERYDALLDAIAGRARATVFEPAGTGASVPARGFDFSIDGFSRACEPALRVRPRGLRFGCFG